MRQFTFARSGFQKGEDMLKLDDTKHVRWGPSARSRWSKCPASVMLPKDPDDRDMSAAHRGHVLHAIAEQYFHKRDETIELIGTEHEGYEIGIADIELIRQFWNAIDLYLHDDATIELEQFVVHPDCEDYGGTADVVIRHNHRDEKTLIVIDLKTGRNPVNVENNAQLMAYAGLLCEPDTKHVILGIFQDLGDDFPLQTWTTTGDHVREVVRQDVEHIAKATAADEPLAIVGNHCTFCPVKRACPIHNNLFRIVQMYIDDKDQLTDDQLKYLRRHKSSIEALWRMAEKILVDEHKRCGRMSEGFILRTEAKYETLNKMSSYTKQVRTNAGMMGVEIDPATLTPAQIRDSHPKLFQSLLDCGAVVKSHKPLKRGVVDVEEVPNELAD